MGGPIPDNLDRFSDDAQPVRYFHLPPSLWRCCLYGVIAGVVLAPIPMAVEVFVNPIGRTEALTFAVALLLAAAFLTQFLIARLKVDRNGISRRILWWWDLWPWEEFADGSVQDAGCFYYTNPLRPLWRRTLTLAIDDPIAVNDLILRVWKRPPPAPIPEIVSFRLVDGFLLSDKIELKPEGISILRRKNLAVYSWADVVRVTIWRAARYRRDFSEIEIELLDRKLGLFHRRGVPNWKGATAEQIAGMLKRHTPPQRLQDFTLGHCMGERSLGERAISVEEADARFARDQQRLEPTQKQFERMTWLMWALKAAGVMFIGAGFGVMIAVYAIMIYGITWFVRHQVRRSQARYEQELADLVDASGAAADERGVSAEDEPEPQVEVGV